MLAIGGPAFAQVGGGRSTGPKLFCVSGAVGVPGVYEVPFGTTLRELLALAGGVRDDLRAILLGGAAGGFVLPDQLDVPLTLEGTREIGATLGSGVVLVLDSTADLPGMLRRIAAFFRDESCGQCVPCRVGTVRQEESIARLTRGAPLDVERRPARRPRPRHAGRVDLRAGPDRARRRHVRVEVGAAVMLGLL